MPWRARFYGLIAHNSRGWLIVPPWVGYSFGAVFVVPTPESSPQRIGEYAGIRAIHNLRSHHSDNAK
jgi:hypothetical protein